MTPDYLCLKKLVQEMRGPRANRLILTLKIVIEGFTL